MARKGVLISNADVQQMTAMQWLFEYHALRKRESGQHDLLVETFKQAATTLQSMLINLLGLNIADTNDDGNVAAPKIIPLSLLAGNPELMKHSLKAARAQGDVDEFNDLEADEEFEELSRKLASGDTSDLDPLLYGDHNVNKATYINSLEYQEALHALGIKVTP